MLSLLLSLFLSSLHPSSGMTTNREKRPFSRLVFTTVYDYYLPPYSFQIRVGALYMFYGLYFTQPAWPKEKVLQWTLSSSLCSLVCVTSCISSFLSQIWIALKDWICIQQFVSDAVSCQHLDVVYVYMKLVSEKAFYYTAMPNQVHIKGQSCPFPHQADTPFIT